MGFFIRVIPIDTQILSGFQVIDRCAVVGKAVRLHCAVHIALRRFFRFFQRRVFFLFIKAVFKMVIDHHLIGALLLALRLRLSILLGQKAVLLDELGNPALYLGPGQRRSFRAFRANRKWGFAVAAVKLMGQPCGGIFFPPMFLHVTGNGVFTFDFAVPILDSLVDVIVRERAQQLVELGIGFVCHFPVQPLSKLRHIREQADQLYIVGVENGAAHSSITLDHSVFIITMTAGVAVSDVLGNSFHHEGLVFLMQLSNRRGCGCFGLPKYSGPVCAKFRLLSIDVLFCLMVDRGHGIFLPLLAALRDSGNGHIMLIPQLFHDLLQPVCWKAAHFHTATAGNGAGREIEAQFRSNSFSVLTVQLKEIAHLIQDHIIRVALLDAIVFPDSRVRFGLLLGKRKSRGCFHILCFIYDSDLFCFREEETQL